MLCSLWFSEQLSVLCFTNRVSMICPEPCDKEVIPLCFKDNSKVIFPVAIVFWENSYGNKTKSILEMQDEHRLIKTEQKCRPGFTKYQGR